MSESKTILGYTYDFGITCSFNFADLESHQLEDGTKGAIKSDRGLIQVIVDHHDGNMNTLNGKQTTHALAMLITQAENVSATHDYGNVTSFEDFQNKVRV